MTVRITKPEFNLREKLTELDYSRVPYEKMPAGSVIQVMSLEYDDIFSSSHSGQQYVDVTDFNLDISPRFGDSKILITAAVAGGLNSNYGYNFRFRVQRTVDGTVTSIGIPPTGAYAMSGGYNLYNTDAATPYIFGMSKTFMDSPATTTSVNYKIQVSHTHASSGAIVYVNRRGTNADWTAISSLTLMEVKQ
tara:strand:+ start:113 stop:688 length:576 start_codon:yes stop_codon:yes gene_type:complete